MNVDVLKDTIKTIGQKLGSALNGILKVHVRNHFFSFITERKGERSVFVMSKMATYFGMRLGDVTGFIRR